VASAATAGGGVAAALAERWRRGAVAPATAAVRLPARRNRPALEWEVTSPSASHSW
jgi:hypothetical protein